MQRKHLPGKGGHKHSRAHIYHPPPSLRINPNYYQLCLLFTLTRTLADARVLTLRPGRRRAGAAAPPRPRGRSWRRRAGGSRSGSPWCSPAPGAAAAAPPPPCARGCKPRAAWEKPRGEKSGGTECTQGILLARRFVRFQAPRRCDDDAGILHYIPNRN